MSKFDKARKVALRHVSGRGVSFKKQGARKHDVKSKTLKKRLMDFSDQFLQVQRGHLYCGAWYTKVGSCKSDPRQHCKTMQHTTKVHQKTAGSQTGVQLLQCITDYNDVVRSQTDGQEPAGLTLVPVTAPNSCPPECLFSIFNSLKITMTISRILTPTTFSYASRHSLTNEHCSSSRVSR